MRSFLFFIGLLLTLYSCGSDTLPKPKSYLTLQYPEASYKALDVPCPYSFEISNQAIVEIKDNCWVKIEYPKLKATVHITYRTVQNNLDNILKEVEKLTFEHTVKADAINARPYENVDKRVFGKLYFIEGDVATNVQFRVTDSLNHVLAGALYFYAKPKYDSILPAVKYIEKDIVHLVETIQWKK